MNDTLDVDIELADIILYNSSSFHRSGLFQAQGAQPLPRFPKMLGLRLIVLLYLTSQLSLQDAA